METKRELKYTKKTTFKPLRELKCKLQGLKNSLSRYRN